MSAMESSHRGEFFRNNYRSLVAYTRQLVADSADRDGEDIVQDVMANLFARADIIEPVRNLTGYVYAAIRNRIVDIMRARKNNVSIDAEIGDEPGISLKEMLHDPGKDALGVVEEKDRKQVLFQAIDSLSDDEKAIVIATEFEGCSFRELSEEWETPMGTLLSRKSRAIEHIGEFLRKKGFDSIDK
jgi:RNA polymerase sigma factor (sigma-70 family)